MATPRILCSCGTAVLFPNGLTSRTCWKCHAHVTLQSSAGHGWSNAASQNGSRLSRTHPGSHAAAQQLAPSHVQSQRGSFSLHAGSKAGWPVGDGESMARQPQGYGHSSLTSLSPQTELQHKDSNACSQNLAHRPQGGETIRHADFALSKSPEEAKQFQSSVGSNFTGCPPQQERRQGETNLHSQRIVPPIVAEGPQRLQGHVHLSSTGRSSELDAPIAGAKSTHQTSPSSSTRSPVQFLWSMSFLCCVALILSLANMGYFAWRKSLDHIDSKTSSAVRKSMHKDTDGDGIPDHHDFCPNGAKGWIASRKTDYDQDGCADNSEEDSDKDGDGVEDTRDTCPFTPQHYRFRTNHFNDFDGDGCYDGHEDHDDDNDTVPNNLDMCPWTKLNHTCDPFGCSAEQRENNRIKALSKKSASAPRSKLQVWIATLRSNGFEVILGFIIAAAFGRLLRFLRTVADHSSEERARWVGKLRGLMKYGVRCAAFISLIFWFRDSLPRSM